MTGNYFTCERLTDHVSRIKDILGVAIYLVEGSDRACVIDTGHGIGNLREYVEMLTALPTFVILTHGHIDHANGAALWSEVYMNPLDAEVYEEHSSPDFRRKEMASHAQICDIPENAYVPAAEKPFLPLEDGQVFDLGGITLEAIWTPGHTPGMTMILIREERMILFGDGCGLEVLLVFPSSSNVSQYRATLMKIKPFEDRYDRIIRNHGTCESPKELLDNCIACCDDILAGTDSAMPVCFGPIKALSAREVNAEHARIDGKQGNILYTPDKRC